VDMPFIELVMPQVVMVVLLQMPQRQVQTRLPPADK
jgi:hypothetical protein